MKIIFSRDFAKGYAKLSTKLQLRFDARLKLFMSSPADPRLRLHPLKGSYGGYWSINITGDVRALFRYEADDIVIFALIGTHSQLY